MMDVYDLWESYDSEQNERLKELPICADCGEYVQDDHYYMINDEVICPECIEAYRVDVMLD
jgi:formylmethanofuran dehydrogenase subunit E